MRTISCMILIASLHVEILLNVSPSSCLMIAFGGEKCHSLPEGKLGFEETRYFSQATSGRYGQAKQGRLQVSTKRNDSHSKGDRQT